MAIMATNATSRRRLRLLVGLCGVSRRTNAFIGFRHLSTSTSTSPTSTILKLSSLSSSSQLPQQQQHQPPSFILNVDDSETLITAGTFTFPPMVSVPCTITTTTTKSTSIATSIATTESNENRNVDDFNTNIDVDSNSSSSSLSSSSSSALLLQEIIKPPNVDELFEWYVTVRNEPTADPSWGVIWPTAISLCNYLLTLPSEQEKEGTTSLLIQHKNVIELGCGVGVVGLLCASSYLGAKSVILSDKEPMALHCALSSAACNNLTHIVQGVMFDWCDTTTNNDVENIDVILASDVLYDMDTVDAFATVCNRLLTQKLMMTSNHNQDNDSEDNSNNNSSTILLVTDPKIERTHGAREQFKKKLLLNYQAVVADAADTATTTTTTSQIRIEEIDLPPIPTTTNNNNIINLTNDNNFGKGRNVIRDNNDNNNDEGKTFDGRDHYNRMKEETVLIRCVITISTSTQ